MNHDDQKHDAIPQILNPEAIGNPKLTPIVQLPVVMAASIEEFLQGFEDYVELEAEALNDAGHLVLNWGRKGIGFGQLSFQTRDGVLVCDNEAMGRAFCKGILDQAFEQWAPVAEVAPLLHRFGSSDALLDAIDPVPGWPR